jgi:hypothetical protein
MPQALGKAKGVEAANKPAASPSYVQHERRVNAEGTVSRKAPCCASAR